MGSSKMAIFIGVPLGGRRRYRVRRYDDAKGEFGKVQGRLNHYDIGFRRWSDWLIEPRGILLYYEGTDRHELLWVDFNTIIINVSM